MAWSAGAVLTAAQMNTYVPQVWSDYTPTWTGSGSNPALGNGTLQGRYIAEGKATHFQIYLSIGSTTTFGSGIWYFSLPTTATGLSIFYPVGNAVAVDSGVRIYGGQAIYAGGDKVNGWRDAGASESSFTPTSPHTWASADTLALQGTYLAP